MRLLFSPGFNKDLTEISAYIAADNPARAVSFALEIRERCRAILRTPEGRRPRADIIDGLRSVTHNRYILFYTLGEDHVRIERVLHGARDLKAVFDNEA